MWFFLRVSQLAEFANTVHDIPDSTSFSLLFSCMIDPEYVIVDSDEYPPPTFLWTAKSQS